MIWVGLDWCRHARMWSGLVGCTYLRRYKTYVNHDAVGDVIWSGLFWSFVNNPNDYIFDPEELRPKLLRRSLLLAKDQIPGFMSHSKDTTRSIRELSKATSNVMCPLLKLQCLDYWSNSSVTRTSSPLALNEFSVLHWSMICLFSDTWCEHSCKDGRLH